MGAGAGAEGAERDGIEAAGAWAVDRGGELARIWGVTWLSRASSAAGLAQAAPPVTRLNRLGIRRWGCGAAGACADKVGVATAGAGCGAGVSTGGGAMKWFSSRGWGAGRAMVSR